MASQVQARGHSQHASRSSGWARFLAAIFVTGAFLTAWLVLFSQFLTPHLWRIAFALGIVLSIGIAVAFRKWKPFHLILFSMVIVAGFIALFPKVTIHHPLLRKPTSYLYDAHIPDVSEAGKWSLRPYFYLLGAWPISAQDRYQLPYEKRPPERFLARIIHYWDFPSLTLAIDGPVTFDSPVAFKECMSNHFTPTFVITPCSAMLQKILDPEWAVLKKIGLPFPTVTHFRTPLIEGLLLESESATTKLISALFVSAQGTTQVVRLTAIGPSMLPEKWNPARQKFMEAIRAQQFALDLAAGRALSASKLSELAVSRSPSWRVSGELMGMASVDPRSYEPFYHLARLNLTWAMVTKSQEEKSLHLTLGKSALTYAHDIRPDDKRNAELTALLKKLEP